MDPEPGSRHQRLTSGQGTWSARCPERGTPGAGGGPGKRIGGNADTAPVGLPHLRSRGNAVVSVRRVAEINAGRKTAGVDGRVALLVSQKADLADWVQRSSARWSPMPVRRVYIPKANGKRRPLGIPVIRDRALQAVVLNALEPEWEARFEPKSYGFRPGRGCHDAIEAIYGTVVGRNPHRRWILDADLVAALDASSHCSFR